MFKGLKIIGCFALLIAAFPLHEVHAAENNIINGLTATDLDEPYAVPPVRNGTSTSTLTDGDISTSFNFEDWDSGVIFDLTSPEDIYGASITMASDPNSKNFYLKFFDDTWNQIEYTLESSYLNDLRSFDGMTFHNVSHIVVARSENDNIIQGPISLAEIEFYNSLEAEDPNGDPQVGITGGSLVVTPGALSFSPIELNVTSNQSSTASAQLQVADNRGTGAGFGVQVTVTDFVSGNIPDPTAPGIGRGGGSLTVKIPASAFSINMSPVSTVTGQATDAMNGPKAVSGSIDAGVPMTILNASPGYGMGIYTVDQTFTLTLPKYVSVQSLSHESVSKYTIGSQIGVRAGTYTGTITYSTIAGV